MLSSHLLPTIRTARLELLDGTGHLSPLEVPDRVAAHIAAFTARTGRGPRFAAASTPGARRVGREAEGVYRDAAGGIVLSRPATIHTCQRGVDCLSPSGNLVRDWCARRD